MKKILCFILSAVLVFNNAIFVYADTSGTIPTPVPTLIPIPSSKIFEILAKIMHPEFGAVEDFFKKDEVKEELDKEGAITYDNDYVYINSTTVNNINNIVQDSVHALDGYYLIEPVCNTDAYSIAKYYSSQNGETYSDKYLLPSSQNGTLYDGNGYFIASHIGYGFGIYHNPKQIYVPYHNSYVSSNSDILFFINSSNNICYTLDFGKNYSMYYVDSCYFSDGYNSSPLYPHCVYTTIDYVKKSPVFANAPFKIFYSKQDLENYLNKGRTYAPKLPNVTIKIPVKYINNSVSLPDITYNITTENKTETEIQNQYDITIKNYLDSLDNFTDGTDPTPTPKPDGGFTDGTTPTPKPDFGDGSDLTDTNDWLKKIYEWLQSFGDTHSKFEKTITDYIEANDGKLDQIIDAIDKLSQGKEDGEDYKCKYDYTELSDYLKKLWNDSDKKFDTMIDLLEESNEYQKKLVDTLDSIKSILIKQSIMDSFKDRSKETADKAKEKFPTSVPWDIAIVINAMSATPEEPKFNLPIKIASLNIDENIEVDLSSGEWEKLAKTCRYMLSLLFVLFMVQLSRRLFFSKGDDD